MSQRLLIALTQVKGTSTKITSQEREFLNCFRPLMTAGLPLTKNLLTPLAKSALIPLRLLAAASGTDGAIQIKVFASGFTRVFSNGEIDDIIKI